MMSPRPTVRPGITDAMLREKANVRRVTADEALALCGLDKTGLWIPFYKLDGKPVTDTGSGFTGSRPFGRLRLDTPREGQKYHSWAGSCPHVFIPPGVAEALARNGGVLHIVEGEFKALALMEAGFATVGLAGFYCHVRPRGAGLDTEPELLLELNALFSERKLGRLLFVGDNDTTLNWQFSDAATKLARDAGVPVALVRIPWDGPGKGADDCREVLGDKFPNWWRERIAVAIPVPVGRCWQETALAILTPEIEAIKNVPGNMQKTGDRILDLLVHAELGAPLVVGKMKKLLAPMFEGPAALDRAIKKHRREDAEKLGPAAEPLSPSDQAIADRCGDPIRVCGKTDSRPGTPYLNQDFFAEKLVADHGLIFEAEEQTFYKYYDASGLWRAMTPQEMLNMILRDVSGFITTHGGEHREAVLAREHKCHVMNEIEEIAEGKAIREEFFKPDLKRPFIHARNGMLCLLTQRLESFSCGRHSRHQLTVDYVPGACCPQFMKLLQNNLDATDIDLFQRWAGLAVVGGNPAQKIMILRGKGGEGKGTAANVLQKLIGEHNVGELRTEQLGERFELSRYHPYRLLYGADVQADFLSHKSASVLKRMVGADLLDSEQKGKNGGVKRRGTWDILITANSRLSVRLEGDHKAWQRRLIFLEFHGSPPAQPVNDYAGLLVQTEGAGILNWLIAGYLRAQQGGLLLRMTPEQENRVDAVIMQSNSLEGFIDERIQRGPASDITSSEVIAAYAAHCTAKGWTPIISTCVERQLPDLFLRRFGITDSHSLKREGKSARGWRGLTILPYVQKSAKNESQLIASVSVDSILEGFATPPLTHEGKITAKF